MHFKALFIYTIAVKVMMFSIIVTKVIIKAKSCCKSSIVVFLAAKSKIKLLLLLFYFSFIFSIIATA